MKLKETFAMLENIKPHAYSPETLTSWINEIEGMIQTDVMLLSLADIITYSYPDNVDTELLVKAPHSKLYYVYLCAMVDFANNEYEKYDNTMRLFNKFYADYMRWYALNINPASGEAEKNYYYISAYSIALKHGYVGSESDWIASLKGDKGDAFTYSDFTEEQLEGLKGDKGDKGDAFTYSDFTEEQLEGLKGDKGDKGDAFTYSDFTEEQLEALKGDKGDKGEKGDKGAPFTYENFTEEQLEELRAYVNYDVINNNFAGAYKVTKSGVGSVVIDDIDHTEHDMNIFVSQEEVNLCPYDFIGTTELFGGEATITYTEDGTIKIDGSFRWCEPHNLRSEMYLEAGTYTIGSDEYKLYFEVAYINDVGETVYLVDRTNQLRIATFTLDTAKTVSIGYGLEIAFGDSVHINPKPRLYKGTEYGLQMNNVIVTVGNASYTPDAEGHVIAKAIYPVTTITTTPACVINVTYNKSIFEEVKKQAQTAISSWGGKNLANTLSPIDASLLTYTQANRFALMPPEYITWERSSDGGVTWEIANEVADSRKVLNVTTANSIFVLPNANAVNTSTLNRLRVTFDFPKGTLYAVLLKLIVEVFTDGAKGVTCEVSTSTYATPDTFVVRTEGELKGEPGYNVFQLNSILLGGYTSSRNTHTRKLRLTVKCDTLTSGRGNNFALSRIYAIAPTAFTTLNTLQKFGDLYQPDWQGNAVFQNGVKANTFTGNLTGAATRAIADEDGNNIIATYQRKDETVKCTYRYTSFTNVPKGYSETIFISTRGGLPDVKDILWIELCPYDETTTKYKSQLTIGEIIYNAETNNIELKSVYNHGEAIEDGQNYEMGFKMLVKSKSN